MHLRTPHKSITWTCMQFLSSGGCNVKILRWDAKQSLLVLATTTRPSIQLLIRVRPSAAGRSGWLNIKAPPTDMDMIFIAHPPTELRLLFSGQSFTGTHIIHNNNYHDLITIQMPPDSSITLCIPCSAFSLLPGRILFNCSQWLQCTRKRWNWPFVFCFTVDDNRNSFTRIYISHPISGLQSCQQLACACDDKCNYIS